MKFSQAIKQQFLEQVKQVGQAFFANKGQVDLSQKTKSSDFDYGIQADKDNEKQLLDFISNLPMPFNVLTEETGYIETPGAEYLVVIDPIDGTVNYSRGLPGFCVAVGIFDLKEQPVFSIVYDPWLEEMFVGDVEKNEVTLNDKVLTRPQLHLDALTVSVEWVGAPNYPQIIKKLHDQKIRTRSFCSGVLSSTYTCIGRCEGMVFLDNKPWDVSPSLVMAKILGLEIKNLDQGGVQVSNRRHNFIIAPPEVVEKIHAILK